MLIVGDLGFNVVAEFADDFRQFLNVGVAEQNMTGVAAGLALNGKVAFTYSIANFSTMRSWSRSATTSAITGPTWWWWRCAPAILTAPWE